MNERLFDLASKKGIKMQYLAKELGIKDSRVYDWKRNRSSPNTEEVQKLAIILGTTEAYLRGETNNPGQNEKSPAVLETAELLRQYYRNKMGRDPTHEEFLRIDDLLDTFIKGLDK